MVLAGVRSSANAQHVAIRGTRGNAIMLPLEAALCKRTNQWAHASSLYMWSCLYVDLCWAHGACGVQSMAPVLRTAQASLVRSACHACRPMGWGVRSILLVAVLAVASPVSRVGMASQALVKHGQPNHRRYVIWRLEGVVQGVQSRTRRTRTRRTTARTRWTGLTGTSVGVDS